MLEIALKVAWSLHGTPYRWGGDDPMAGFDCSGFVIEVLKSAGMLPSSGDWTAQGLMELFKDEMRPMAGVGCLVFYGTTTATHVEFCLNSELSIGASGGGSSTTSPTVAEAQNAYVKVRPIGRRSDILGYADPFMGV